ncbi:MAG: GxxExxY protein [Candidatus Hydrogenedentes bacterium]|nr:GxxExxY protein [Candidatus Hydrogenedentota bacterium]
MYIGRDDSIHRISRAALTETIIGCAFPVYNHMGFGLSESVFENCMMIEIDPNGLHAVAQQPVNAKYEGVVVGDLVADIVVHDTIIVELKSVRRLSQAHEAQLVNCLVATGKPVGLLLNFGTENIEAKKTVGILSPSCKSHYPVQAG